MEADFLSGVKKQFEDYDMSSELGVIIYTERAIRSL